MRLEYFLWLSIITGGIGFFISFYPGTEFKWYLFVVSIAIPALWTSKQKYRILTFIIIIIWLIFSINGYYRGKEYQEWLEVDPMSRLILTFFKLYFLG